MPESDGNPGGDGLLALSGTRLAALIRERRVSSSEVVDVHIRRIETVNPRLNAVVADRFERAREEARAVDERLARSREPDLPPFLGVPFTLKENFAFPGMPNTSGLPARRGVHPVREATPLGRLRAAGAIPVGVTNVSELCMWMEADNRVYGRTNCAWDPGRTAGGSSGGEGAIVGAGGVPFGLGADIGGSIRLPAFFNGVFGHKPSGGLVPGTGQYPISSNEALQYLTTGPLARRAEDLMPLLRILAGPDGEDLRCEPFDLGDPGAVAIRDLDVILPRGPGLPRVSDDLVRAVWRAADHLDRAGARLRVVELPEARHLEVIWSSMMSAAGGPSFSEMLGAGEDFNLGLELLRCAFGRSDHTLPALGLAAVERVPAAFPGMAARFVAEGHRLAARLTELAGPRGVLLVPPYLRTAPSHGHAMLSPFGWVYTAIFNVLRFPSTAVPMGLDADGIPLGVQVVGPRGQDHRTIGVALELERAFGGWVRPGY